MKSRKRAFKLMMELLGCAKILKHSHFTCFTGPDFSRFVEEFETLLATPSSSTAHHEEARSWQV